MNDVMVLVKGRHIKLLSIVYSDSLHAGVELSVNID